MNQVVLKGKLISDPILAMKDGKYYVEILIDVKSKIFQCIVNSQPLRELCIRDFNVGKTACVYAHLDSVFSTKDKQNMNKISIIVDDIYLVDSSKI